MSFEQIHKTIKRNFGFALGITLFHVLIGYIIAKQGTININQKSTVMLKTLIILYVLISIPLILKIFSDRLKKIATYTEQDIKIKKYIKFSRIRIFVILVGLISALMLFFIRQVSDMLYIVGIETIVLFLCIPTKSRITQEMAVFTNEEQKDINDNTINKDKA